MRCSLSILPVIYPITVVQLQLEVTCNQFLMNHSVVIQELLIQVSRMFSIVPLVMYAFGGKKTFVFEFPLISEVVSFLPLYLGPTLHYNVTVA